MKIITSIQEWWARRQQEREERRRAVEHGMEIQRRYRAFEANPTKNTRSPWIRSLIGSPMWNENVRAPGASRIIGVSHPSKAAGREFVISLLAVERCIRFRHYPWAWRGIFSAMADDMIEATYTEERERIYRELLETCPDEKLSPARHRGVGAVQGMVGGYIKDATKSLPARGGQG